MPRFEAFVLTPISTVRNHLRRWQDKDRRVDSRVRDQKTTILRNLTISDEPMKSSRKNLPNKAPTELVNTIVGGRSNGEPSEKSIKLRIPSIRGLKDSRDKLKSTLQAAN